MPEVTKSNVTIKAHCGCGWFQVVGNPFSIIMIGEAHAMENNHTVQFTGECRVPKRPTVRKERSRDFKRQSHVNMANMP